LVDAAETLSPEMGSVKSDSDQAESQQGESETGDRVSAASTKTIGK